MKYFYFFVSFYLIASSANHIQAQKKIVVLGSSTAAGGGVSSNDSAWVNRLQAHYRKNTSWSDPDTTIINHAVGGYNTYRIMPDNFIPPPNRPSTDIYNNVTKALSYYPDIIIINMPSNDIASGYSPVEVMNNFRLLNQLITSKGVRAYFTTTQPRNDIDMLHRTQQLQLVDSIYNNFGNNAINFWDDLVTQDGQLLLRDDRRADYVHPNNTGHRFLFERVLARQIFVVTPASSSTTSVPGKVQAENFVAMNGIQTENTADVGGGLNVGYQDNYDWMDYSVNVSTGGTYNVNFRVASQFTGAQFQLRKSDGSVLASITVPNTGNFQSWQTVSASISLAAGQQTLRIVTTQANGGWNFNWMEFVQQTANRLPIVSAGSSQTITLPNNFVNLSGSASDPDGYIVSVGWSQVSGPSTATIYNGNNVSASAGSLVQGSYTFRMVATDNSGASNSSEATVYVNAATPAASSSMKIEAENYSSMYGIQTENTFDAGGGLNVGYQDNNDWMDYTVNVSTGGTYLFNFRVASMFTGAQFQLRKSDGTALATLTVPNTGNFQSWQTVSASVYLSPGQQTLRVVTIRANGGWNFNWMEIAGTSNAPLVSTSQKIEAENYSGMYGIQTENTFDAGGGLNVGYQDNNDWMDYTVDVSSSSTYTINFRVASMFTGAQFQLRKSDGSVLATITVPNTGNFQSWQTVSASVYLSAGQQTLRVVTTQANGGWNFNWMEIAGTSATPPAATYSKIEAENYSGMYGIQTENTFDAGGGLNVGYQDNNDWMDYTVNVNSSGTYNINFRVASMFTGAQFQLRNSYGSVLATITVPNTGNFQSWQTVSASVYLPAGQQTLRVVTTQANGGWNFNWMEITGTGTTSMVNRNGLVEKDIDLATNNSIDVFPNPVHGSVSMKIANVAAGSIQVDVLDYAGRTVKRFTFNKDETGTLYKQLYLGDLNKGVYIIQAKMNGWSTSKKIIKR